MKDYTHMVADQAAESFYGQDAAQFAKEISAMTAHDPRLVAVFQRTREDFLRGRSKQTTNARGS